MSDPAVLRSALSAELASLDAIASPGDDLYARGMRCAIDHLRDWLREVGGHQDDAVVLRSALDALREKILALHRYTITSEGASAGYFRLVEDPNGCWAQWPEIAALLTALPLPQLEETKDA